MPEKKNYSEPIIENSKINFEKTDVMKVITSVKQELNSLQLNVDKDSKWRWWNATNLEQAKLHLDDFYSIDEKNNVTYHIDKVASYLSIIYDRINNTAMLKKYSEQKKEKIFDGTILAIQIALQSINPKYDVGTINWVLNDETIAAIKNFQTDKALRWKDWKPWRETIWKILEALNDDLNQKEKENESMKNDVRLIVDESVKRDLFPWTFNDKIKNSIVDYILDWNINSWKDNTIEIWIRNLSSTEKNREIKYLVDNTDKPLKENIEKIKEIAQNKLDSHSNYWEQLNDPAWSFCWIKLESNKPYDVSSFYQFETGRRHTKNNAFQNCQLTRWLWKIWVDKTLIVDKNGNNVNRWSYHTETWYSQRKLPWGWLEKWKWLKWRHVADDWTVRDWDWYIVVAAHKDFAPQDSIVMTTLWPGKVYDTWCAYWRFDIYVDW